MYTKNTIAYKYNKEHNFKPQKVIYFGIEGVDHITHELFKWPWHPKKEWGLVN
jgi:hypothetical protein